MGYLVRNFTPAFKALWRGFQVYLTLMERLAWATEAFAAILLVLMWGLLFLNTLAGWEWVVDTSIGWGWTVELVGYLVPWTLFMMIGPVAKLDMHIKVTYLPLRLLGERRGTIFIRLIENLAGMAICSYMTLHACRWIAEVYDDGGQEESAGGWFYPMWIVRLCIPIGFFFVSFFYLERTIRWGTELAAQKGEGSEHESGEAMPAKANGG